MNINYKDIRNLAQITKMLSAYDTPYIRNIEELIAQISNEQLRERLQCALEDVLEDQKSYSVNVIQKMGNAAMRRRSSVGTIFKNRSRPNQPARFRPRVASIFKRNSSKPRFAWEKL